MPRGQGKIHSGFNVSRVKIDTASSGDNTLVTGVANETIKILSLILIVDDDVTITLKDGSTAMSGAMKLAVAGNGFVLPPSSKAQHWLETTAGANLVLNLGGAVQVSGWLVYCQENPSLV